MLEFTAGVVLGLVVALVFLPRQRKQTVEPYVDREARDDEIDRPEARLGVLDITPDQLAQLRDDPRFAILLLLGRMSNSLRFAHTAPLEVYNEGTPRANRQLNGAFFLQVATTQEVLDTLRGLAVHLKDREAWQSLVVPLLRDPEVAELEREGVRDLRRKIVFHFDLDAIRMGLAQAKSTQVRLLASRGAAVMDVYFPYSDEVALAYVVPTIGLSPEEYRERVLPWLRRATDLSIRVASVVESLAVDLTSSLGLRGVWLDEAFTA